MRTSVKLTAFVVAAGAVFGSAYGVGSALDPIVEESVDSAADNHGGLVLDETAPSPTPMARPASEDSEMPPAEALPGLAVSDRGYTLRLRDTTPEAGDEVELAFDIASPDGGAVLNYAMSHEKQMHLIVVRRDLTGFQHLHPELGDDGTWRTAVDLTRPGVYRVFADFVPTALAQPLTLGADLFVAGEEFEPAELPDPTPSWSSDGYEVTLDGAPRAGSEAELTFTVRRDGAELTDLEPYLGAFGHLVSLRSGDLAYLHTHPADEAMAGESGGPQVRFGTTFPTAGRYRLYLNFAHDGVVHTAELTVEVPAGTDVPAQPTGEAPASDAGHSRH